MKLIDMLAGTPGDDPKDKPSGVKFTVEPSAGLLETVDGLCKDGDATREAALLAYAALGAVSGKAAGNLFGLFSGVADVERKVSGQPDSRVLEDVLIRKRAFEDAAQACDEVASRYNYMRHEAEAAMACAAEIRARSKKECNEVASRFEGRTA